MRGLRGQNSNGRYYARPPTDNPIMDNQVLRLLMNLGGVTRAKAEEWCRTEAAFVRNLRYQQSRRGRVELQAYSTLAKVLYVLTLPLSLAIWLAASGWSFFREFFSNGQNVFLVALIGLSMALQAGAARKVVHLTSAMDTAYFRHVDEEISAIWRCFDHPTAREESSVVGHLVRNRLYSVLEPGEPGIEYDGADLDGRISGLGGFFGGFPIAPPGNTTMSAFALEEASKLADEIRETPLQDLITPDVPGFRFVGEAAGLGRSAEWAVERFAASIVGVYDEMMQQVWDQRPEWRPVVGSLRATIDEELETLVEELGADCREQLKSTHHHLLRGEVGARPLLAKLAGDAILATYLGMPLPPAKLFSDELVEATRRELMQAAASLLVPPMASNSLDDITYVRPEAEFQRIDFPSITPTLRFNLTQLAVQVDLATPCGRPGHVYFRLRLHRTLHSALVVYHSPHPSGLDLTLLYLGSPVDQPTPIGTAAIRAHAAPLAAHFRIAMTQAAVRSRQFALKLTTDEMDACLINLPFP